MYSQLCCMCENYVGCRGVLYTHMSVPFGQNGFSVCLIPSREGFSFNFLLISFISLSSKLVFYVQNASNSHVSLCASSRRCLTCACLKRNKSEVK